MGSFENFSKPVSTERNQVSTMDLKELFADAKSVPNKGIELAKDFKPLKLKSLPNKAAAEVRVAETQKPGWGWFAEWELAQSTSFRNVPVQAGYTRTPTFTMYPKDAYLGACFYTPRLEKQNANTIVPSLWQGTVEGQFNMMQRVYSTRQYYWIDPLSEFLSPVLPIHPIQVHWNIITPPITGKAYCSIRKSSMVGEEKPNMIGTGK